MTMRSKYRKQILDNYHNNPWMDDPKIWEVIGITEHEYHTNGSEYTREIKAAEYALHDILWAQLLFGWKVWGITAYDRILAVRERAIPHVEHAQPSRKEREYPGGFGSPIDWSKIVT